MWVSKTYTTLNIQQLCKQLIGAAMGGKPIPDYANIFMAKLDKQIMQVTDGLFPDENKIKFFKL